MKKISRILFYTVFSFVFLSFCAYLLLRYALPTKEVKEKITAAASKQLNAQVEINDIYASLSGLYLSGVNISQGGRPLLNIEEVQVQFSLIPLIKGLVEIKSIDINGLAADIIREADGTFNFEKLLPPKQQAQEGAPSAEAAPPPVALNVGRLQIRNSAISFVDKQQGIYVKAEKFFFDLAGFSFKDRFRVSLNTNLTARYKEEFSLENVPLGFTVFPQLNNFELDSALAQIKTFVLRLGGADISLSGLVKNFNEPDIKLDVKIQNLSADDLKPLAPQAADLPAFNIPAISLNTALNLNYKESKVKINSLILNFLSSKITAGGSADYGKAKPEFKINTTANIIFEAVATAIPLIAEYQPKGQLKAQALVTQKDVSGSVNIISAAAFFPQAGTLKDFNLDIEAASIKDIKIPVLKGALNGNAFRGEASYLNKDTFADIVFKFYAENVLAKDTRPAPKTDTAAAAPAEAKTAASSASAAPSFANWPLPPLNIKAEVIVGRMEIPFLIGNDIRLKADLRAVDPNAMEKAHGSFSLTTDKGVITDIYRLINAHAITKVLFVSLGVITKVINTLNVLDTLSAISSAVIPGGKKDESQKPVKGRKLEGKLDFSIFEIFADVRGGVSEIRDGYFSSDMLSFRLKGDIDFNTEKLKMTVKAAPGKVGKDGIMPLTIHIGGTLENPSGSMSMVGSVAALVTQSVFRNPATNLLKKTASGIGGILGIGHKKEKEEEEEEEVPWEGLPVAPEQMAE